MRELEMKNEELNNSDSKKGKGSENENRNVSYVRGKRKNSDHHL